MSLQELIQLGVKVTPEDVKDLVPPGFTPKEVCAYVNGQIYRNEYNKKPEVQAARKAYNRQRNAQFKLFRQALKDNPNLLKGE